MISSVSAASATVRVIGPVCATDPQEGGEKPGERGTSPNDGFRPNTPQKDEGTRIDPTPSVRIAIGPQPAATPAAAPPLDPPLVRPGSQGLRGVPVTGLPPANLKPDSKAVV